MKKLVLVFIACLCLFAKETSAQWVEVTNPDGTTQNYSGIDVTVTAVNPAFNGGCNGTYWVNNTGGVYTFTFNPPVSAVQFHCDAINTSEETSFSVNGVPFPLNNCNVEPLSNNCIDGPCNVLNGYLINNTSFNLCGGLITVYGNITSASLNQQFGNSGTTFDLFIPPNTNIPPPGASVTAGSNSPVDCGDMLNLTAVASGGTAYSWTGPNGYTSNLQNPSFQVNNLSGGQYIVTATTPCGPVSDTVDVVVAPFNLTPTASSNTPVCENGVLNLTTPTVAGGTYTWTGPGGYTSAVQNPSVAPVPLTGAGTYSVVVTVNNCNSQPGTTNVAVVALPPAPGVTNITYCLGDTTAVPLTATGNNLQWYVAPVGGSPLPGAPTPNTTVAGNTTYYVSSTGPAPTNCEGPRAALTVTVNSLIPKPDIQYVSAYCSGDVFVPFVVLSGQNILYYTQLFGGVGDPTPPTVDPTVPGVYHFYASQTINGCESERLNITITVHPFMEANFTHEINYGCEKDTLIFTNTSIGSIGYMWYFGDGTTSSEVSPEHIYADQDTYKIVLISNALYCRDTFEQTIDLRHPLDAVFTTDVDTICQGQSVTFTDGSVYALLTGVPPTYNWNFGDGGSSDLQNPVYTFNRTGVFTVTMIITDFVPCYSGATHTIYVDSISPLVLNVSDSMICAGDAVFFTGNYTDIGLNGISWDFGDGITSTETGNPAKHSYENPGSYTIKLANDYRVCPDLNTETVIAVRPQPRIVLGKDTSMCPTSAPLVLNDLINGGNANATWLWNTGATTFSIAAKEPATYWSRVTIDGCSATDSIDVRKDCYLDIPNAFAPDGDGMSDYFFPRQLLSDGVNSFKMSIYNRWGQEIFTTTNTAGRGWDGKFNEVDQPQGVYVYLIEVAFKNGVTEKRQGNVTLLR